MSHTLVSLMPEYDQFLVLERRISTLSRKAYRFDVTKYFDYTKEALGRDTTTEDPQDKLVRTYLSYCQGERELKAATLARMIASLRTFFIFCLRENYLKYNAMARIQNPKRPRKLPVYLLEAELQRLLHAPDRTDEFGSRDFAIMATLGYTGVRLRELVMINLPDVDFVEKTIKVFGKGAKERQIPLSRRAEESIREYMKMRQAADGETALFVNRFGRRLSGRSVENIVKKYVTLAGIDKASVSPHKLRHTFATLLHNQSVDLLEIKTLLGHQNISTTQIYTSTNPTRLRQAVGKLDQIPPTA